MKHETTSPSNTLLPLDAQKRIEDNRELQKKLGEFHRIYTHLKQGVDELWELENTDQTNYLWKRSVYRAVFSWIEGVVYQMKQVAIHTQGGFYRSKFTRAELALLNEESYVLNDKGKVKTRDNNFSQIDKNLRFAFSTLAKGYGISISTHLDVGGKGWQQFKKAIDIRNRVTHPKKESDLTITDDEMQLLHDTVEWFDDEMSKLFSTMQKTIEPIKQSIRSTGRADLQKISDDFSFILTKAQEIEDVIAIIRRPYNDEDSKLALSKLKSLKNYVLRDYIS